MRFILTSGIKIDARLGVRTYDNMPDELELKLGEDTDQFELNIVATEHSLIINVVSWYLDEDKDWEDWHWETITKKIYPYLDIPSTITYADECGIVRVTDILACLE